jgi:hypothetical protein
MLPVMISIILLLLAELVTYFALLVRLSGLVRERKPELFAAVGGLHFEDFLVLGFGTGESLISRLEAHADELREEPNIVRLLLWARVIWWAQLVTVIAGLFVLLNI